MMRLIDSVARSLAVITGIVLVGLIVINGVYAVSRNVFGYTIAGVFEVSEVMLPIVALLALAGTQRRGAHVSVELLAARLSRRTAVMVEAAGLLFVSVFLALAAYVSGWDAIDSFQTGEYRMGLTKIPVWPARGAIALGLFSLVLQLLLRSWKLLKEPGT